MYDIIIVGGGASGMTAAITAKETNPSLSIAIFEKMEKPLRKVKASGNGRCNMTNQLCPDKDAVLDFFRGLGVLTRSDDAGRIYPYTEESSVVVNALTERVKNLGIEFFPRTHVTAVEKVENHFEVSFSRGNGRGLFETKKVLLAAGGKSAPKLGTTGDGAVLASKLGLKVSRLAPALTSVVTTEDVRSLAGIRAKAELTLEYDDGEERQILFREEGEIQFTEYGISGICVFNMSRFLTIPEGKTLANGFEDYTISIDFLPEEEYTKHLDDILEAREGKPGFEGHKIMRSMVSEPIAKYIYNEIKDLEVSTIGDMAAASLHFFTLHVEGVRGWQYAQVTKGGVDYDTVDAETMESKEVPGLYLSGEVLDYEGPCGGFNLQHAFYTGLKAGRGMAR